MGCACRLPGADFEGAAVSWGERMALLVIAAAVVVGALGGVAVELIRCRLP
jgi:hypothetical protein